MLIDKNKIIPYGRQCIDEEDIQAVISVLRSDWLTTGPSVSSFENSVTSYCDVSYGVAVCNATAALHIACLALGVQKGDLVWTTPNTFVASANCALYCGADVDFVDIDPKTYNMCPHKLEEKLLEAKRKNKLPKVVIPVDFSGQSCDMKSIYRLSQLYGFKIIEDASHAIGGSYEGHKIGSCRYSDITIFSFHPVKIVTTGEGGMAVTNKFELFEKMNLLRTHGINRDPAKMSHGSEGDWYGEQIDLGMNYRITDIQCALGSSQMRKLDRFIEIRQKIAEQYNELLESLDIQLPMVLDHKACAYHLYVIQVEALKRKTFFDALRKRKIGVQVHYFPVHLNPYYQSLGFQKGDFPIAEKYYERAISLPIFPDLKSDEMDYIVNELKAELL